jgi:hypothetical protein
MGCFYTFTFSFFFLPFLTIFMAEFSLEKFFS